MRTKAHHRIIFEQSTMIRTTISKCGWRIFEYFLCLSMHVFRRADDEQEEEDDDDDSSSNLTEVWFPCGDPYDSFDLEC